jgi:hypothetical protein
MEAGEGAGARHLRSALRIGGVAGESRCATLRPRRISCTGVGIGIIAGREVGGRVAAVVALR